VLHFIFWLHAGQAPEEVEMGHGQIVTDPWSGPKELSGSSVGNLMVVDSVVLLRNALILTGLLMQIEYKILSGDDDGL
jgi:hypothetical protein